MSSSSPMDNKGGFVKRIKDPAELWRFPKSRDDSKRKYFALYFSHDPGDVVYWTEEEKKDGEEGKKEGVSTKEEESTKEDEEEEDSTSTLSSDKRPKPHSSDRTRPSPSMSRVKKSPSI